VKLNAWLVVALAAVGLLWYIAYQEVDKPTMPQTETSLTGFNASLDACTAHEFFRPETVTLNQELVFTPHRYPNVTGGNISTLIHQGFSALRLPAPQDNKWITCPPGEVMY